MNINVAISYLDDLFKRTYEPVCTMAWNEVKMKLGEKCNQCNGTGRYHSKDHIQVAVICGKCGGSGVLISNDKCTK